MHSDTNSTDTVADSVVLRPGQVQPCKPRPEITADSHPISRPILHPADLGRVYWPKTKGSGPSTSSAVLRVAIGVWYHTPIEQTDSAHPQAASFNAILSRHFGSSKTSARARYLYLLGHLTGKRYHTQYLRLTHSQLHALTS